MSYMSYTIAPETVQIHGTHKLISTVPFCAYGMFWYMFKVHEPKGEGPVDIVLSAPILWINGLLWISFVMVVVAVWRK
jgi:hypothetical protein